MCMTVMNVNLFGEQAMLLVVSWCHVGLPTECSHDISAGQNLLKFWASLLAGICCKEERS